MPKRGLRRGGLRAGSQHPVTHAEIMATYRAYRAAQPLRYPALEADALAAIKRRAAERGTGVEAPPGARGVEEKKRGRPLAALEAPLLPAEVRMLARIKLREKKPRKKRRGREGGKGRLGKP
ncbi:MAG: hypothetical protein NTW59_00770 [Candidatus Diapherotrites archaeon]|nr:hypothetical protein [Candidatus Diapherotrites archaeon]